MSTSGGGELLNKIIEKIDRGDAPRNRFPDPSGEHWALCPFHADKKTGSFSFSEKGFSCFACGVSGGLRELGEKLGIPNNGHDHAAFSRADHEYQYFDSSGKELFVVLRTDARNGQDKKIWRKPKGVRPPWPLFRLPELVADSRTIVLLEGEKKAEVAQKAIPEYFFTCWSGGAPNADKTDFSPLAGRKVVLWPDNDQPGLDAMKKIGEKLTGLGCPVCMTTSTLIAEKSKGHDIVDALAERGENIAPIRRIIENAKPLNAGKERFHFTQVAALETQAPEWIIKDFVEKNTLSLIFGDSETYKSFLGIAEAASIAADVLFFGQAIEKGAAFYIAGEGLSGIKRRFMGWAIENGIALAGLPLFVASSAVDMVAPESVAALVAAIDAMVAEHGAPSIIILDTLARNFGPGDENSTADMNLFISACDKIRERFSCTVQIIHHTGHGDKTRARGGYTLKCAIDSEFQMEKDDAGIVRLTCTKMKDAEHPAPKAFQRQIVDLGFTHDDGRPVTSLALREIPYTPKPQKGRAGSGQWQTVMISILRSLTKDGPVDPNDWREKCMDAGVPRQRFSSNKTAFLARGLIISVGGLLKPAGEGDENDD